MVNVESQSVVASNILTVNIAETPTKKAMALTNLKNQHSYYQYGENKHQI